MGLGFVDSSIPDYLTPLVQHILHDFDLRPNPFLRLSTQRQIQRPLLPLCFPLCSNDIHEDLHPLRRVVLWPVGLESAFCGFPLGIVVGDWVVLNYGDRCSAVREEVPGFDDENSDGERGELYGECFT